MDLAGCPFFLDDEQRAWVESVRGSMDRRAKAGQLLLLLGGRYSDDRWPALLESIQPGGVLFRPGPAAELSQRFRQLDSRSKVPLLKAANLEDGGSGAATDGTFFAPPLQLAATGDPIHTRRAAAVAAEEGKDCGCHWSFSPVVDIALNPRNPITATRTFGVDPATVSELALVFSQELQARGVAACAKHFPGDGVDDRDQHLHPTVNTMSCDEWDRTFRPVYQNLIDGGVLSIMAGHILLPSWSRRLNVDLQDEDILPASLSAELLQGLLRTQMGFNGLICSDASIMAGFTQSMERCHAVPQCIAAGCDVLLFPQDVDEDLEFLIAGVETGVLSEQRLDEAVTRVLALKAAVGLHRSTQVRSSVQMMGVKENTKLWMTECADQSVTLVKNRNQLLPLSPHKTPRIEVRVFGTTSLVDGGELDTTFADLLRALGFQITLFDPGQESQRPLRSTSELKSRADVLVCLANFPVESDQTTVRIFWKKPFVYDLPKFVHELPTIFISFAWPFHLQDVPRVQGFINAYSASQVVLEAVSRKLTGESPFLGESPVDAFGGYWDAYL